MKVYSQELTIIYPVLLGAVVLCGLADLAGEDSYDAPD